MFLFILKSSACLLLFYSFYKLVLEQESMHVFKRFYLLGALVVSIIIPLITFTTYVEIAPVTAEIINDNNTLEATSNTFLDSINWPVVLGSIYGIGFVIFGFRFVRNLYKIDIKIKRNPKNRTKNFTNVLLKDLVVPHTFFNYIFFNKQKFEAQEIPIEVFWHEQTHAREKHSIDVLIIEFLQVVFWFNPLFYCYNHLIKLNHEFLADQGVLNKGVATKNYQETILTFSSNTAQPVMANAFNYSLIKKRFTVMKTKTTKKAIWIRSFVLLPLLALMLYSFSSRETIQKDVTIEDTNHYTEQSLLDVEENLQEGATKEQIKEYNALAKKLDYTERKKNYRVEMKDVERLKYLYGLMTDAQRANAAPFPNIPPPPPPAPEPEPVKIKVREVPPPPPPIPPDATPAQKAKYEKAIKSYKIAVEKAAKAETDVIRVREISDVEKVKLRQLKEEHAKERRVYADQRRAEMLQYKEQLAKERQMQAKEREVLREQYKKQRSNKHEAKIIQEKLKQLEKKQAIADKKRVVELERRMKEAEKRQVKLEEKRRAAVAQRVKLTEERQVRSEAKRRAAVAERAKRQEERVAVREIREVPPPPPPPKSPLDHVVDMAKKGATFYIDNKKVSSDEAIDFIKNNEKISISTKDSSSKKAKVYISKNN